MDKYLFIDRDGTLIAEPSDEQVDSLDKLDFEPMVINALQALIKNGYRIVMVSNQDGLGTPSFPTESYEKPQNFMLKLFKAHGIELSDILVCPHFPADNCKCRKPKTGLVLKYLQRTDWDRKRAFVIGDRETDMKLAENMGIAGIRYSRENNGWQKISEQLTHLPRTATVERNTRETRIRISVDLDHSGNNSISTGIGFFDHMLDQIATHGGINLNVKTDGDLQVDEHHSVEDTGIALGEAIREALGDKRGIRRFGFVCVMDEVEAKIEGFSKSLLEKNIDCAMDISGRPYCNFICDADFLRDHVGEFPAEMVPHFFRSLSEAMGLTLHMSVTEGNTHHQIEALFKGFGRALRDAVRIEGSELPSSKGVL